MKSPTIKELKKSVYRKVEPDKFPVTVYRWIAIYLTKLALYTPITPNQISFLASLTAFIAAVVFVMGDFWYNLLAVFLLFLAAEIDYVDGSVARFRGKKTVMQSRFLDDYFHEIPAQFIFIGIGIALYSSTQNVLYIIMGFTATLFQIATVHTFQLRRAIVSLFTKEKFEQKRDDWHLERRKYIGLEKMFVKGKVLTLAQDLFVAPMKYIRIILLVVVLGNWLEFFLPVYAIFLPLRYLMFLFFSFYRIKNIEEAEK